MTAAALLSPQLTPANLDYALLNDFQRDFPLTAEPYKAMACHLGCPESLVLSRLAALQTEGSVSRVGVVFAPRRVGASTLAALAVPVSRLEEVAHMVNAHPGVNHNYERENVWNLWFVATAPDEAALTSTLDEIRRESACPLLKLPLATEYHIDLGFDLKDGCRQTKPSHQVHRPPQTHQPLPVHELSLVSALQEGLPLIPRPFQAIGQRVNMEESQVVGILTRWLAEGIVKRCGVVVRHHELGFRANAMCVWSIPDDQIDGLGQSLATEAGVNLCYRRDPAPDWPYNLYCMLHGRDRSNVEARIQTLADELGLTAFPSAILFSRRRFKQRGARYGRIPL